MRWRVCALGFLLVVTATLRADEIRLKDGSKIVGTIVDFESDSFKVQTAYGFAMVRKDSIAQIIPSEPDKNSESASAAAPSQSATIKPATAASSSPGAAVKPEAQPAVARSAQPAPPTTAKMNLAMPVPNPRAAQPTPLVAAPTPASAPAAVPAPVPAAPSPPPAPVVAGPIRESVQGTVYSNASYNFQLYRPPGWDLIPEARKAMPNAITAMGTPDETTLFIVGREPVRDSMEAQAGNSERALQKVYENYRHVSSAKKTIAGLPAVEWQFRGVADGHDWSVTALTVARGADVFTLLGMTYADSDLIQIRENVIAKMIASLQFSAPQ
jgi:hypothetical protein